ncbi:MAG TPA: hypothetical protein VFQ53_38005 [Kofleriaceae bacterium]|nr:hypothetical protein [Kofleriaceae bacterium]
MTTDSADQLLQARGVNPIHDWHPPLMAALWRLTDKLIAGPFPMLVIQSSLFLLGLYRILQRIVAPRTAAIVAAATLLFPPVMAVMVVIWKDSQMAGFLLAGTACLLSTRRAWKLVGLGLLCLATAQRYNAFAATLPLVLCLFVWGPDVRRWKRYVLATATWLVITVLAFASNRALTKLELHAWHCSVALMDIAGMVKYAPKMSDDEVRQRLSGIPGLPSEHLQSCMRRSYSPRAWFWLANGSGRVFDMPQTDAHLEAISESWWEMITTYPRAYVGHRFQVVKNLLALTPEPPEVGWSNFVELPPQEWMLNHSATHSTVQHAWTHVVESHRDNLVFRPWLYLLLGLFLLPLCARQRIAFAVLASGLACELSVFVAAPSADYRYSHWMIVCTTIAYAILFATRWQRGRTWVA